MIYIYQVLLLIYVIASGLHDGDTHKGNVLLTDKERKAWHFKGGLLFCILITFCYLACGWKILIAAVLLRTGLFDPSYNKAAGLKLGYIGDGREFLERLSIKIFGGNGAVKKAVIFFLILVALNVINELL